MLRRLTNPVSKTGIAHMIKVTPTPMQIQSNQNLTIKGQCLKATVLPWLVRHATTNDTIGSNFVNLLTSR